MRVLRVLARLVLAGAGVAVLGLLWLGFVWPPPGWWNSHWPARTAFMRMRAAELRTARDTTPLRYQPVPLDSMTRWLTPAATVAEDDAFFQHHGIDWHAMRDVLGYRRETFAWGEARDRIELRRALGAASRRLERLRGASTITQQLAKNLYLSPSRNPLRKVKEAVIAYRLEWALPKERILALYLNVAEFGENLWGVEAASRQYFARSAGGLSMDQAALLVATLPHPRTSNPGHRPGRTRFRAQLILRRLRGESIEVPREADADEQGPAAADAAKVLADSLEPRADSTAPRSPLPLPNDTAPAPVKPDTGAVKPPGGTPTPR